MRSNRNSFRIRLEFDSPPPGMPISRKYIILVKPDTCKTICDLEHTIIRKFGFSKGSTITLAIDGFALVPTEDVDVLSNDDILSANIQPNLRTPNNSSSGKKTIGKDNRTSKSVGQNGSNKTLKSSRLPEVETKSKATKTKKRKASSTSEDSCDKTLVENGKARRKLKRAAIVKMSVANAKSSAVERIKTPAENNLESPPYKICSDGEKAKKSKLPEKTEAVLVVSNPINKGNQIETSSENNKKRKVVTPKRLNPVKPSNTNHITFTSSSSDSEMETATPVQINPAIASASLEQWLSSAKNESNPSPNIQKSFNYKDPGVSTNVSVIYENPTINGDTTEVGGQIEKKQERPDRNYLELLPLTWPPRAGDVIAYKILEMSEDYTPVISDYKEAKILEVLPSRISPLGVNAVKMQYLWPEQVSIKREGGRFEMEFSEDEQTNDDLTLEWQTLLEPKRID